jgi:hypothetical protein
MSGNMNQRPFLLLIMKIMRVMLWCCIASLLLVGGGIWYSVTKVQARAYEQFTNADIGLFSFIAGLIVISGLLLVGVHRMIRRHA